MKIFISNSSDLHIYKQVIEQIRTQIISGNLKEGQALPSIRKLAKDLHISVITIKRAYEELEREGFIDTLAGKGCFVAHQKKEFLREQKMKIVEDKLNEAIVEARLGGIGLDELKEMLDLLYEEE